MEDDYERTLRLLCSTCGSGNFEYDEEKDDGPVRCSSCDRVFTREELTRENGARIDAELEDMQEEVVADLERDLADSLRKAFSGTSFKFK